MQGIEILKRVCGSIQDTIDVIGDFSENEPPERQNRLVELSSTIDEILRDGTIASMGVLAQQMINFDVESRDVFCKDTIKLMASIIKRLFVTMQAEDWETDIINIEKYELYTDIAPSVYSNIWYFNPADRKNEMLLMDCTDEERLKEFLNQENSIEEMLLRCLYHMSIQTPYQCIFVARKGVSKKKQESRIEFIKLAAVLKGKKFQTNEFYERGPVNLGIKYKDSIEYAQFAEIVDVMNEYNIQKHILDKYLRIYQVIENFMFKQQLCEYCDRAKYKKLSVRDFKGISETLSTNEGKALENLLKKTGEVVLDGECIKKKLYDSWKNTIESSEDNKEKVKKAIELLAIYTSEHKPISIEHVDENAVVRIFGRLIYSMRCSIVHNKVNEYHITYINLDEDIKWLLENYMMSNMEMLVYGLMLNENSIVMYKNKSLNLY